MFAEARRKLLLPDADPPHPGLQANPAKPRSLTDPAQIRSNVIRLSRMGAECTGIFIGTNPATITICKAGKNKREIPVLLEAVQQMF